MTERIEVKAEKSLTIDNDKHGGTTFKVSHNLLEKHIRVEIKNGSEPTALIDLTSEAMNKLGRWLLDVANEVEKL